MTAVVDPDLDSNFDPVFTGGSQTHEFGRGRYGGEGVFFQGLGETAKDDGLLLTCVYDELEGGHRNWWW